MPRGRQRTPLVKVLDPEGNELDFYKRLGDMEAKVKNMEGTLFDIEKGLVFEISRLKEEMKTEEGSEPFSPLEILTSRVATLEQRMNSFLPPLVEARPMRTKTYVVQKGDTLAKISKSVLGLAGRYVEIATLNRLSGSVELEPGQVLKLPVD